MAELLQSEVELAHCNAHKNAHQNAGISSARRTAQWALIVEPVQLAVRAVFAGYYLYRFVRKRALASD